ncbi:Uncharacterized protein HZ326_17590, partial [Fusarium oxysporum f. sp. albedinis]|jgi:hypothetical protein
MDEAIAAAAMSVVMIVTDGSERRRQRIRPLPTTDENNNIRMDTKEGSEQHELEVMQCRRRAAVFNAQRRARRKWVKAGGDR